MRCLIHKITWMSIWNQLCRWWIWSTLKARLRWQRCDNRVQRAKVSQKPKFRPFQTKARNRLSVLQLLALSKSTYQTQVQMDNNNSIVAYPMIPLWYEFHSNKNNIYHNHQQPPMAKSLKAANQRSKSNKYSCSASMSSHSRTKVMKSCSSKELT